MSHHIPLDRPSTLVPFWVVIESERVADLVIGQCGTELSAILFVSGLVADGIVGRENSDTSPLPPNLEASSAIVSKPILNVSDVLSTELPSLSEVGNLAALLRAHVRAENKDINPALGELCRPGGSGLPKSATNPSITMHLNTNTVWGVLLIVGLHHGLDREELQTARGGQNTAKDLRSRVVQLASQNAQISAELVALGEEKARVENDLEKTRSEVETLQKELSNARHELTDTHKRESELESANSDLTRRYEEVASELERASIDMVALREDVQGGNQEALIRECNALRERVADLETQLSGGEGLFGATENMARPDTLTDDQELTAVADISPALIQWMQTLQEAVGDLRRQMRTAADESVMLETNESVEIISVALSSAVERVETAREAIKQIIELVGLGA